MTLCGNSGIRIIVVSAWAASSNWARGTALQYKYIHTIDRWGKRKTNDDIETLPIYQTPISTYFLSQTFFLCSHSLLYNNPKAPIDGFAPREKKSHNQDKRNSRRTVSIRIGFASLISSTIAYTHTHIRLNAEPANKKQNRTNRAYELSNLAAVAPRKYCVWTYRQNAHGASLSPSHSLSLSCTFFMYYIFYSRAFILIKYMLFFLIIFPVWCHLDCIETVWLLRLLTPE